jgi:hypothetical protein
LETLDMRLVSLLLATCFAASAILAGTADAGPRDSLKVKPDTFIDTSGVVCEAGPVDSGAASSQWVNKSGKTSTPDAFGEPADFGLVLAKNVDTPICAAALATLNGPEGETVSPATVFGYSFRADGHCGAGAPRFNVTVTDGTDQATYAVGCANTATSTAAVNADWTAKTWTPDTFFFLGGAPGVPLVGSGIVSVVMVFDEGTDVGPGEATLDDIRFNNLVAGGPATVK